MELNRGVTSLSANKRVWIKLATALIRASVFMCIGIVQPTRVLAGTWDPALAEPVLAQLPTPGQPFGSWDRPCVSTMKEQLALRRLSFTTPALQARFIGEPQISYALYLWGVKWLGMPAAEDKALCRDLPHVLRLLQQTAGDAPTGIFGERDMERIETALRKANSALANVARDSEQHLPNVFGIFLGAPLRMGPCQTILPPGQSVPKFVPSTCQVTLGRSDQPQPTATVYFSQADQPSWLSSTSETRSAGLPLPNPSVLLELHDRKVTALRFNARFHANAVALDAITEKFGVSPDIAKPRERECVNLLTGLVFRCDGKITNYRWNVKDLIVAGYCNDQTMVCEYKIQLASEATRARTQTQQQEAQERERALRSGRPL